MHMTAKLALLPLFVSACVSAPPAEPPRDAPMFVQYRTEDPDKIRLKAPYRGVLTQRGLCLGLTVDGRFTTIIWPETARVTYDAGGLLLRDVVSKAKLRLGDTLAGTGGPLPAGAQQPLGGSTLSTDMPIECARYPGYPGWIGFVSPGFRKG